MATGVPNVSNNDAFAARNFAIEVDGTMIAQFTELSGLTSEMDVTELKENGPDGKLIIKKIPGAHKTPTLTLKRAKNVSMELYKWHKAALDGKVKEARKNGSVILYDYQAGEIAGRELGRPGVDEVPAGNLAGLVVIENHRAVLSGFLDLAVEGRLVPLVELHRDVLRSLEGERRRLVRAGDLLDDQLAVGAVLFELRDIHLGSQPAELGELRDHRAVNLNREVTGSERIVVGDIRNASCHLSLLIR